MGNIAPSTLPGDAPVSAGAVIASVSCADHIGDAGGDMFLAQVLAYRAAAVRLAEEEARLDAAAAALASKVNRLVAAGVDVTDLTGPVTDTLRRRDVTRWQQRLLTEVAADIARTYLLADEPDEAPRRRRWFRRR